MLTRIKQKIQQMLTGEATAAHKIGLTPNVITTLGLILALLAAISYTQWLTNNVYLLLATILLLLSGFCDALDGIVARQYNQATPFGGFFDSVLDRYGDAAVYLAIIGAGLCDLAWGIIALTGSILVSYTRARAEAANVKMESIGIAERAERILILAIASILAFTVEQAALVMNWAVILLAVLTNVTVLQRSLYAYKNLKKQTIGASN